MNHNLTLINRTKNLFDKDIRDVSKVLNEEVSKSSFLVLGGAGSIGQSVVKEIFIRNPKKLHVVDISENNLAELIRDIRSSLGYISGEFQLFALDITSPEYDAFIENDGEYDYVLNLSALKHVRSEKDPYTLMRMIKLNILTVEKTIHQSIAKNVKKYFCVSTDKATNPVNMMGASKKIMELFLFRNSLNIKISTARFANVAFSDGSLLSSFANRFDKMQPIASPSDIYRYFITSKESGELCLMSCIFGENRDIFFPKFNSELDLVSLSDIAKKFVLSKGYEPHICISEKEAREEVTNLIAQKKWPCIFSISDTTGEKDSEEFFTDLETLEMKKYHSIGIIKNSAEFNSDQLDNFLQNIQLMIDAKHWTKKDIKDEFLKIIPNFSHIEKSKSLDDKM